MSHASVVRQRVDEYLRPASRGGRPAPLLHIGMTDCQGDNGFVTFRLR